MKIILLTGGNSLIEQKSMMLFKLYEGAKGRQIIQDGGWNRLHFNRHELEPLVGEAILITTQIPIWAPLPFLNVLQHTSSTVLKGDLGEKTFNRMIGKKE